MLPFELARFRLNESFSCELQIGPIGQSACLIAAESRVQGEEKIKGIFLKEYSPGEGKEEGNGGSGKPLFLLI